MKPELEAKLSKFKRLEDFRELVSFLVLDACLTLCLAKREFIVEGMKISVSLLALIFLLGVPHLQSFKCVWCDALSLGSFIFITGRK